MHLYEARVSASTLSFHPSPAFVLVILSFYRMVSASATAWARTGRGLGMGHQLGQRFAELSERVGRSVRTACWRSREPGGSRITGGSNVQRREEAGGGWAEDHHDIPFQA